MYTGVQNILGAFDSLRYNVPYFSIWCGRDMLFQCNTDDLDQGRAALVDILNAAEQSDNTDVLLIKFHPALKKGYVTNTSEVVGTLPVRVVELEDGLSTVSGLNPLNGTSVPNSGYFFLREATQALGEMKKSTLDIQQRIAALETGNDKETDWFDKISGILEKPGMPDLLGQILSRFLPVPQPQPNIAVGNVPASIAKKSDEISIDPTSQNNSITAAPANIATISDTAGESEAFTPEEDQIINDCISRLSAHCDVVQSLVLLAEVADANPQMFKMVLNGIKV